MSNYIWPAAVIIAIFGIVTYTLVRDTKNKLEAAEEAVKKKEEEKEA